MISLDPYAIDLNINPETNEHWVELRDDNNELAARVRYTPSAPEATATEFVVTPDFQASGVGKNLIVQMFDEMKAAGATTARLIHVIDPAPFIKYGCTIDGQDALVDLEHGTTLDQLKASL